MRTPAERRKQDVVAQSIAATEPLMAMLDAHLGSRAFMAGGAFTMADIPLACEIHRWHGLPLDRPARPHLERWYGAILEHAASRGVLDAPLS